MLVLTVGMCPSYLPCIATTDAPPDRKPSSRPYWPGLLPADADQAICGWIWCLGVYSCEGQSSGNRSERVTAPLVAASIAGAISGGRFSLTSQDLTVDCRLPIKRAKADCPPAILMALLSAFVFITHNNNAYAFFVNTYAI